MELILSKTLLLLFAATIYGQNIQQDKFLFPPQFQSPSSSFTSDSSIFLPTESHTPVPYFAMHNLNHIPLQFLQSSGTKIPSTYPTSLPIYMSSTLNFEDEETDENDHDEKTNNPTPVSNRITQSYLSRANNNTLKQAIEKKDNIVDSRLINRQQTVQSSQSNQLRFDVKPPSYVTIGPVDRSQTKLQNPAARRMILTSEIQRAETGSDLAKASSYQTPQYVQAPGVFISSTTEPAIPILRLSNEMDLDGSFSYEALGADQTHYVQHSRMENMGSDKEEQVVEGSYSYIGDDGRTYTVHYVADSNGFRATGDHLPVPPPVPEIIQRAVQYNLAEEAKKPPHLKSSWENDDKEYELNERNFYNNLPSRNLFTGKTPEAFSFGFSQGANTQNNLVTAASYQVPSKSNYENSIEQTKPKINAMPTPQITFLASQGAHNPSQKQPVAKVSNSEKLQLPQLMNYEAEIKDSDQEANKALWRWQYGLNTNINKNPKNSISRSFAEGDEVVINFSDMTPDQYTHMINTQILSRNTKPSNNIDNNSSETYQSPSQNKTYAPEQFHVSTETINLYTKQTPVEEKSEKHNNNNFQGRVYKEMEKPMTKKDILDQNFEIINTQNRMPQNNIVTQSYEFDKILFEPSEISIPKVKSTDNLKTIQKLSDNVLLSHYNEGSTTSEPLLNTVKTTLSFHINEENNSFRPIIYNNEADMKQETTTMEASINEKLSENIFLRSFFNPSINDDKIIDKLTMEKSQQINRENKAYNEVKQDKEYKHFHHQLNPQNEIKIIKPQPLDINNILNYVVLKNHFESIKTKQKNKPVQHFIQNTNEKDMSSYNNPIKENTSYYMESNDDKDVHRPNNDLKTLNRQQEQELQGFIKNYKVLQRHKNTMQRSQLIPEPQRHIKAFHAQNQPPLGRAGPSMKSYLPPTYL